MCLTKKFLIVNKILIVTNKFVFLMQLVEYFDYRLIKEGKLTSPKEPAYKNFWLFTRKLF